MDHPTEPDRTPTKTGLESILADCLDRFDAEGQAAVDDACAKHPDLADVLRAKMQKLRQVGLVDAQAPDRVGPYRIVRLLGSGGMGSVLLAEQEQPVRRQVALKVIRLGMDTAEVVARFESERQALALMSHDGIAKVYEAGSLPDGRPYFVMEYVDGAPISDYCDQRELTTTARLRLFVDVCRAVAHAHQNGIIHRDLKPTNILVHERDGKPIVKVIDFGLAKAIDQRLTERTLCTELGQVIGTPAYMSPEQADPRHGPVDTRTDVYSLGVVLYELLVGVLPIDQETLRSGSLIELQRAIIEDVPPRPSIRMRDDDTRAERRGSSRASLCRQLRGDLDWIVMRAIEKDPERRYASVTELATDIERHLSGDPVFAGPPSTFYVVRKLVRKHRATFTSAVLLALMLVGALIAVSVFQQRAQHNLERFDLLASLDEVTALRERVDRELWPAHPDRIPSMQGWLHEADAVIADRPMFERAFDEHRADGTEFELFRDRLLDESLTQLTAGVRELESVRADVVARLDWANDLERLTLVEPKALWDEAIASIANEEECPKYRGLRIKAQLGLIPLGRDLQSGLWEFWFPQPGGAKPAHGDDRWIVDVDTDLVLVLVPGGVFLMGADPVDRASPNHDPFAKGNERPPHDVELGPFFISKYEVSQGQWLRFTGSNPSMFTAEYRRHRVRGEPVRIASLTHPVEQVSWLECTEQLRRLGLLLPTEAQWEYAARAGTGGPWWTGSDQYDLQDAVSLGDETARRQQFPAKSFSKYVDDGYVVHAPVDSMLPNDFGLHNTLGNVWEWCRDDLMMYGEASASPGDGFRGPAETSMHVFRGGSYNDDEKMSRASNRWRLPATAANGGIGLRPVRVLVR